MSTQEDNNRSLLLQCGRVVTRNGLEIEFFPGEKEAGAFVQHIYGVRPWDAKQLGILIEPIDKREPKPGDAFVCNNYYACQKEGDKLIDTFGILETIGGDLVAGFNVSAFRSEGYVSCSGGPLPFVEKADLVLIGLKRTRFWRWGEGWPEAHAGGDYYITVPLWRWKGDE